MTSPFLYPAIPLERRHAPGGYARAANYRPWLRDEFCFRCVFCLIRERWLQRKLEVEHFEPVACAPDKGLHYDNLLYACRSCNEAKAAKAVPDPCQYLVEGEITSDRDGFLHTTTKQARKIVLLLGLNSRDLREFRRLWIRIIELAEQQEDRTLFKQIMAYPDPLPDLAPLRPPGGNAKPAGIEQSHHARRARNELPDIY